MTLHPRLPLAGLLILLLAPTLWAQPDSEPSTPEAVIQQIETALLPKVRVVGRDVAPATLQERMAFHGVPAVSIAVIDQGKIAWAKAYGLADVEAGRAATTETLFQSASMSKPVATMTALQLVQDGLLELDGPINESLAYWQLPASAFTAEQPVTLRHLMTHTAGTTVSGFLGYAATDSVPTTMQVLDGESPANTQAVRSFAKPGHSFRYSGGGMTIMQLAMADVTETSFVELTRERMLGPAGMERSTYAQPLPAARALEAATAYDSDGTPIAGRYHTYPEMAAAGLWTTPTEYASWILTVNEAVAGASNAVLSQALTDSMLTANSNGWGLGMPVNGTGDALAFMHGGSNAGYKCQMVGYPHRGQGAVVMTNSDT
ncbi:MAG: serine hydrolase domain-containing protein, partial [Bacteroidota bacterium]